MVDQSKFRKLMQERLQSSLVEGDLLYNQEGINRLTQVAMDVLHELHTTSRAIPPAESGLDIRSLQALRHPGFY